MNTEKSGAELIGLDDDPEIGELISSIAELAEVRCKMLSSATEFLRAVDASNPTIITLDLQIPDMDGIEVLRQLAERRVDARIILVTGMDSRTISAAEYYATSLGLTVIGKLAKPFDSQEMIDLLSAAKITHEPPTVDEFLAAIERKELMLHYQPVARRTEQGWAVDSVEALLRWEHPQRGRLFAEQFIDLAVSERLSRDVTDYVLRESLEQLKGWLAASHDFGLRVNLSAALIVDVEFPDRMESALNACEIRPELLTLEINETDMFSGQEQTIDILTRLRLKGIRLAIDDFGIGYSSLTQLFRMPFSEMKIDRALTEKSGESKEGRITVEALVDLAHKLGLTVCAEGVESESTLDLMWAIGCDSVQGYVLSPPAQGRDIPRIVRDWHRNADVSAGAARASNA